MLKLGAQGAKMKELEQLISQNFLQKIYYYAICLIAFFVLMWGAIDLTSSALNLVLANPSPKEMRASPELAVPELAGPELNEPANPAATAHSLPEDYYQRQMLMDRFGDSLARTLIGGIIFAYARYKVAKKDALVETLGSNQTTKEEKA